MVKTKKTTSSHLTVIPTNDPWNPTMKWDWDALLKDVQDSTSFSVTIQQNVIDDLNGIGVDVVAEVASALQTEESKVAANKKKTPTKRSPKKTK